MSLIFEQFCTPRNGAPLPCGVCGAYRYATGHVTTKIQFFAYNFSGRNLILTNRSYTIQQITSTMHIIILSYLLLNQYL